jgi:Flp pilus assembly protein TadB
MNVLSAKPCNVTVTLHRRHTPVTHLFNIRSTSVETQNNQGGYLSALISRLISCLTSEDPSTHKVKHHD